MTAATAVPMPALAGRERLGILRLLLARRSSWLPLGLLVVLITASVAAPLLAPYGPNELDPFAVLKGPSARHLFGTDELGRDLLSRTLFGGRLDLLIMASATALAMAIGVTWGSIAAVSPGLIDGLLMR